MKLFSPLRGTNSKTTHCFLSYSFWLNSQGTTEAPAVDLSRLNTLRGTKPLKGATSTPVLFIREGAPLALTMLGEFEFSNIGLLGKWFNSCGHWRVSKLIKYFRSSAVLKISLTRIFTVTNFFLKKMYEA